MNEWFSICVPETGFYEGILGKGKVKGKERSSEG